MPCRPSTPAELRRLIRRALEKDPRRRLRDIGDARVALEDVQSGAADRAVTVVAPRPPRWTRALPWSVALLSLGAAGFVAWLGRRGERARAADAEVHAGDSGPAAGSDAAARAVAGRQACALLARRATVGARARPARRPSGAWHLWRAVPVLVARQPADRVPDTERAVAGGPGRRAADSHRLVSASARAGARRAASGKKDGTIVFAPAATGSSMMAVSSDGGEFRQVFDRDPKTEGDFHKPSLLPDGESMLCIVDRPDTGADTIAVVTGTTRKTVLRLPGEFLDSPVYSPTGHLLYHRETTTPGIWAVPFSLERLETTGTPFLVVPQGSWPAVGSNGVLVYARSELTGFEDLAWLDIASGAVTTALERAVSRGELSAAVARWLARGGRGALARHRRRGHRRRSPAPHARADRRSGYHSTRPAWRDNQRVVYALDAGGQRHPHDASRRRVATRGGVVSRDAAQRHRARPPDLHATCKRHGRRPLAYDAAAGRWRASRARGGAADARARVGARAFA